MYSSSNSVSLCKPEGGHFKEYTILFLFLASHHFLISPSTLFLSPSMLGAGSQDSLDVVLTCSVCFSTKSPLYPLSSSPPTKTCRQAALNILLSHLTLDEPVTTLLSPNNSPHIPHSCTLPTKLFSPTPKQKEPRQLEQLHPQRRFCNRMEARTSPNAPNGT